MSLFISRYSEAVAPSRHASRTDRDVLLHDSIKSARRTLRLIVLDSQNTGGIDVEGSFGAVESFETVFEAIEEQARPRFALGCKGRIVFRRDPKMEEET